HSVPPTATHSDIHPSSYSVSPTATQSDIHPSSYSVPPTATHSDIHPSSYSVPPAATQSDIHSSQDSASHSQPSTSSGALPSELHDEDTVPYLDESVLEAIYEDWIEIRTIVEKAKYSEDHTSMTKQVNTFLDKMKDEDKFEEYISKEIRHQSHLIKSLQKDTIVSKDKKNVYKQLMKYHTSEDYKRNIILLLGREPMDAEMNGLHRVNEEIRESLIHKLAGDVVLEQPNFKVQRSTTVSQQCTSSRGKVRYVGSYVLAKIKYQHQRNADNLLGKYGKRDMKRRHVENASVQIVNELCRTETQIISETEDADSIALTIGKQYAQGKLNHISDKTSKFFTLLTEETLSKQKEIPIQTNIGNTIANSLIQNDQLKVTYEEGFDSQYPSELPNDCDRIQIQNDLYVEIINLFVRVLTKQLRKDFINFHETKKTQAHRKKVLQKKAKNSEISWTTISNDQSVSKCNSHNELKRHISEYGTIPSKFTKLEATHLAKMYNIPLKSNLKKSIIVDKLLKEIPSRQGMSNANYAGPSRDQLPRPKVRYQCPECLLSVTSEQEGIQCDRCNKWVHKECSQIDNEHDWDEISKPGIEFICHFC
ncbi:unnamed protein product, partial [Owenia fusiformis]